MTDYFTDSSEEVLESIEESEESSEEFLESTEELEESSDVSQLQLQLVDFTSASDELQASIYVTNQLLMTIIVILSLMFIRKILLSIKGRFYN